MQPDLPEPVVPAIRMCGIRARSVQTALPEMSLPSQTESGLDGRRQVVEDVAERDEVRARVRHLDADRLLARDRREDADLGRRERVGEVVLEPRDLRDLRPGRELQLVARHARAGDLADRRSPRRRSSRASGRAPRPRGPSGRRPGRRRARSGAGSRGPAGGTRRGGSTVTSNRLSWSGSLRHERRRLARPPARETSFTTSTGGASGSRRDASGDGASSTCSARLGPARRDRPARRAMDGAARGAEHRAGGGAGHEQAAGEQGQDPGDRDAGRADREREPAAEQRARRSRRGPCRA